MKKIILVSSIIIVLSACTQNLNRENSTSIVKNLFDSGRCEEIKELTVQKDCTTNQAIIQNDVKICDNLKDINRQNDCYEAFAVETNNIDICEKIDDKSNVQKINCKVSIKKDLKLCYNEEKFKDSCISRLAAETGNKEICEQASDFKYDSCVAATVKKTLDKNTCYSIENELMNDLCITIIADETNNPELCEEINDKNNKGTCYFSLFQKMLSSDLCKKTKLPSKRCKEILENK